MDPIAVFFAWDKLWLAARRQTVQSHFQGKDAWATIGTNTL
jgi:hypothetical protein